MDCCCITQGLVQLQILSSSRSYLKTPPKATSSPKIHAVESFSNAISMALVIACNKVIFVVSPENVVYGSKKFCAGCVQVLGHPLGKISEIISPHTEVLPVKFVPLVVSVGSGVYVKCALLFIPIFGKPDEGWGSRHKIPLRFKICCVLQYWLPATNRVHAARADVILKDFCDVI